METTTTNIEEQIASALREDNAELLKPFLESKNVIINYREPRTRKSLIVLAAEQGRVEIVRLLLTIWGVNVTWRNNTTPLMLAAENNHLELVKLLLEKGANVSAIDSPGGWSALHFACYSGYEEIAKVLYQNGASIFNELRRSTDIANKALEKILTADKGNIVRVILDSEKNKERVFREVLFSAIECGWSIETLFTTTFASFELSWMLARTLASYTPLSFIAVGRSLPIFEMVKLLLDRGANVHWSENSNNYTALHYAAGHKESTNIMQLLLEYGADVNAKSSYGGTPLHVAVRNQRVRATKFLLSMGADVNIDEEEGNSSSYHFLLTHRLIRRCCVVGSWSPPDHPKEKLEVVKVVVKHIVKLLNEGLFVSESNLKVIRDDEKLSAFQADCEKEIEKMIAIEFSDSVFTLHDVFKAESVLKLATYAKNREMTDYFKSDRFRRDFPIYSETIWNNVCKGVERNYVQARVCNFFTNLFTRKEDKLPELPVLCASKIFSYLSDKDLINLRKAYY